MSTIPRDTTTPNAAVLPRLIITAIDDGGLGHFDLMADPYARVAMVMGPLSLDEVGTGDTLRAYMTVDGVRKPIASHVITPRDLAEPSPVFTLEAEASEINKYPDGSYLFSYDVLYSNGKTDESVGPVEVTIKRSIPGDPADPSAPVNDALPAPAITPSPVPGTATSATVTVAPWTNMSVGDIATVRWERLHISAPALSETQIGQPVVVTITEADLREVGGMEDLPVAYEIFDVVGNHSGRSPYTFVDVEIEPPDAIAAPRIKEAENGTLDPVKQGSTPFTIQVPLADHGAGAGTPHGVSPGDVVIALFEGRIPGTGGTHTYTAPPFTAPSPIFTAEIPLPVAEVMPVVGGTARVSYTLVPPDGSPARHSRHLGITIAGVPELLPAVVIQEDANHDNVLDPDTEIASGAHVDIDYPNMALDDYIVLDLLGRRADGMADNDRKTRAVSKLGKQTLVVDKDYLARLKDGTLTLKYVADSFDSVVVAGVRRRGLLAKRESYPLDVQIRTADAEPRLPAPQVSQVKDGLLDPATPEASLIVPGISLLRGDVVEYTWTSVVSDSGRLTARADGADLEFAIDESLIKGNLDSDVRVSYTRTRGGTVTQSDTLAFRVAEAVVSPPAPTVPEDANADGTLELNTELVSGKNPHAVIPASAGLVADDTLVMHMTGRPVQGSATAWSSEPRQVPSGEVGKEQSFAVPAAEVTSLLGGDATFHYTVESLTPAGVARPSLKRKILIRTGTGVELPPPQVPEAVDGVIGGDVVTATFRVPATAGLPVGTQVTAYFNGTNIGSTATGTGPADIPIPATAITAARGSTVVLFYSAKGPGESRLSPELNIAVAESNNEMGVALQMETFDLPFSNIKSGETRQFRLFRLEADTPACRDEVSSHPPHISGPHLLTHGGYPGHLKLKLTTPSKRVRIGAQCGWAGLITAYSEAGAVIKTFDRSDGWFDVDETDSPPVAYFEVDEKNPIRLDNLLIDTGYAWHQRRLPHTETFDSFPIGDHGELATLGGWDLRSGGGHMSIETAPPGLTGRVVAAHDPNGGADHDLSPRFAIQPTTRISIEMAASAKVRSTIYVGFVDYTNSEQRVAKMTVDLNQGSTTATFIGPDNVCRSTEYLAFIGTTGVASTTIYYGSISFE